MKPKPISKEAVKAQIKFFREAAIQPPQPTEVNAMTDIAAVKTEEVSSDAITTGLETFEQLIAMLHEQEDDARTLSEHDKCRLSHDTDLKILIHEIANSACRLEAEICGGPIREEMERAERELAIARMDAGKPKETVDLYGPIPF